MAGSTLADILVLDDEILTGEMKEELDSLAEKHGLTAVYFTSGIAAMKWLGNLKDEELPTGYLVDMKIITENPDPRIKDLEYDAPEHMLYYLENIREVDIEFRFYTGHYRGHDIGVHARTNGQVITKPGFHLVDLFFKTVKRRKDQIAVERDVQTYLRRGPDPSESYSSVSLSLP